jgi:predicted RNase H-like nuclease (RuvC/YqgF family)
VSSDRYKEMWEDAFHDNLEKKAEISELKAEVARLKAEVERLTLASQGAVKYVDHTMALTRQSMEHHKQSSRLEAQVERLTKVGDAMASILQFEERLYHDDAQDPECVKAWNAAKEVQS